MAFHSGLRLWLALFVVRLANAAAVQTFAAPDEYWQALEPAYRWVFGYPRADDPPGHHGIDPCYCQNLNRNRRPVACGCLLVSTTGYLTWEWRRQIRGYLHPLLFVPAYWLVDQIGRANTDALVCIR